MYKNHRPTIQLLNIFIEVKLWHQLNCVFFFPHTLVSSTNKTYRHNITEILLKVALNNITLNCVFNVGRLCTITVLTSNNVYNFKLVNTLCIEVKGTNDFTLKYQCSSYPGLIKLKVTTNRPNIYFKLSKVIIYPSSR